MSLCFRSISPIGTPTEELRSSGMYVRWRLCETVLRLLDHFDGAPPRPTRKSIGRHVLRRVYTLQLHGGDRTKSHFAALWGAIFGSFPGRRPRPTYIVVMSVAC